MKAELGIFARTFVRDSPAAVADAVAAAGFTTVQLNLSAIGLPTIPRGPQLDELDLPAIGRTFADRGISIWGVSATFNLLHPDERQRRADIAAAAAYIARAKELDTRFVTLCTGTRDADDMWRRHPDNDADAAWADLRAGLDPLLAAAAAGGVRLGIEPERGNVVSNADRAAQVFTELGDGAPVAIVLDPANLLTADTLPHQHTILRSAFATLAPWVECVQAKDVVAGERGREERSPGGYSAAGVGGLDYDLIFSLWAALPRAVPVIAQDSTEQDAPRVRRFLESFAAEHPHSA